MNYRTFLLYLICILLFGTSTVYAADARVPIYQPATISQPGHYYLTRNIDSVSDPVISITANDVTLDFNGYTISSPVTTNNLIDFTSATNILIFGGNMSGGMRAIHYNSSTVRTRVIIRDIEVKNTNSTGILLNRVEYAEVCDLRVINVGGQGISISGVSDSFSGKINGNFIESSGFESIYITGLCGGEISRNKIVRCQGTDGITLWGGSSYPTLSNGNILSGNTVTDSQTGIRLAWYTDGNLVTNNVVSNNNNVGIEVDYFGNRIINNICKDNGSDGFWANFSGTNNLFLDNMSEGNGGYGINSNSSNYYRNNMLVGNTSGAVSGGIDAGGNII